MNRAIKRFEISLNVDKGRGSAQFNLGGVAIPRGAIVARLTLLSSEGVEGFVVSAELLLESSERSYKITMPCAISVNEPCYRILALIPGYDAPMKIDEGAYTAKLSLNWSARGSGVIRAALELLPGPEPS